MLRRKGSARSVGEGSSAATPPALLVQCFRHRSAFVRQEARGTGMEPVEVSPDTPSLKRDDVLFRDLWP